MSKIRTHYFYATVFTVVLFTISISIFSLYNEFSYNLSTCMPHKCFCEIINYQSSIKQLSNTLSSFSFVYLGFLIIFQNSSRRLFQVFGIFIIAIGFGSSFFHATLSMLGQSFDLAGIYLLSSFIFLYALYRLYDLSIGETIILMVIINFVLDIGLIYAPELRRYLVVFFVVLGILSELFYLKNKKVEINIKWIKYSIFSIISAFLIWILDIKKILCYPQSIFQGHALWHLLSMLSIYFLYLYYRSEKN